MNRPLIQSSTLLLAVVAFGACHPSSPEPSVVRRQESVQPSSTLPSLERSRPAESTQRRSGATDANLERRRNLEGQLATAREQLAAAEAWAMAARAADAEIRASSERYFKAISLRSKMAARMAAAGVTLPPVPLPNELSAAERMQVEVALESADRNLVEQTQKLSLLEDSLKQLLLPQ